jgi:uncharacterized protein YegP (UPF0339 family)
MLTFYIYPDHKKEWRWRLEAPNHKAIASSGEGYKNRADMIRAINMIKKAPIKLLPADPGSPGAGR